MKAGEDPAISGCIEEREREALIPAGLFEWVVADQPDPLEGSPLGRFEDRGPGGHLIELACDREHLFEVSVEDRFEAPPFRSAGDPLQSRIESASPARQRHRRDHKREDDRQETDDERAEVGLNERVEVDPTVLQWAARV